MSELRIKRGDVHTVTLTITGAPEDLDAGTVKVLVTPYGGGTTEEFTDGVTIASGVVSWNLDGTLAVGRYNLEVQVTVGSSVITAPSDRYLTLVVVQDLG